MNESHRTERDIFLKALEKQSGEERNSYLDEACAGKADLRRNVEALLQAHQQTGDLLDRVETASDTATTNPHPHPDLQQVLVRLEQQSPSDPAVETQIVNQNDSSPEIAESTVSEPENRLGRFHILRELGRGGFGLVFQAYDPKLDRDIALKVPRYDTLGTPELRKRFLHEAKAAAGLDHPNIVPIYDVGELGPICYIALAYCEGDDLAHWLSRRTKPVPPEQAASIVESLAVAIQHGHERGILHRDVKPSNVLLVPKAIEVNGHDPGLPFVPRLTDFGMAKLVDANLTPTRSSLVIGTPQYMAPEQASGSAGANSPQADIYALGVILYELLTKRLPFAETNIVAILDELRHREPPPPSSINPSVNRDLETICLKCLQKRPSQRYRSAKDLASDLRKFLRGEPITARRLSRRERFANWCGRRERIRDAGIMTMVTAAVMMAFVVGLLCALILSDVFVYDPWEIGWGLFWLSAVYVPLFCLGFKVFKGRRWAMWCAAAFFSCVCVYLISNWVLPGDVAGVRQYEMFPPGPSRLAIEILVFVLFGAGAVLNFVALWADRRQRAE